MKILLVSDQDPIDSWIAVQLSKRFNCSDIMRVDWQSQSTMKQKWIKAFKKPRKALVSLYISLRTRVLEGRRDNKLREFIGSSNMELDSLESLNVIEVSGSAFNRPKNVEKIRSLQPDLMIVCGGPLLKEEVFSIPRLGTWNIHFGISPFYRGQHTILWPLMMGDFHCLGATIHQIDRGVDTGRVFARLYPEIEPGDTELSIELKMAALIQSKMTELLEFVESNPSRDALSGIQFEGKGRQIFTHDLTPWVEAKYLLRRLLGGSKLPYLPERHELFYKQESDIKLSPNAMSAVSLSLQSSGDVQSRLASLP